MSEVVHARTDAVEDTIMSFDGVKLATYRWGPDDGTPVVLCHGFASDTHMNFVAPGLVAAMVDAGRRVIAFDARGHGRSDKPYEPEAYADGAMVRDVSVVFDAFDIHACDLVGYSMGAFTSFRVAQQETRPRSLVLGGVGKLLLTRQGLARSGVAEALDAEDAAHVGDPTARGFRLFAERTGADRRALAALQRSRAFSAESDPARVKVPTLVLVGEGDRLIGNPRVLADALPDGRLVVTPGDHISAPSQPPFRDALVGFLLQQA